MANAAIEGNIATKQSTSTLTFSPNNTTTTFGTLPGVTMNNAFTYQIHSPILSLQAPTVRSPAGRTTIQGTVAVLGPSNTPPPCALDVDGNGVVDALTDGLIILRAMFGLTGTAVTSGAVGTSPVATRLSWAQLQSYLNGNCGTGFAP